jgi:septal ring factor EnvC (AmiA/AmiB activator)
MNQRPGLNGSHYQCANRRNFLMNDPVVSLTCLLNEILIPNLKTVQASQTEQIAASHRLQKAIEELRAHLESQFAHLTAQLTACRAELAATQAILKATQEQGKSFPQDHNLLVN